LCRHGASGAVAQFDTSYQESRPRQRRVGGQVAVRGHVVGRVRQLAAAHPGGHPGAVLDDQRVRAHVVHPGADRRSSERRSRPAVSPGVP
jgi:hypothetical protein